MSELTTGRELAEKVLRQVTEDPETHFQATWVFGADQPVSTGECGTTACLAGWAVVLNANPGETPRAALRRIARHVGIFPSWESVAAELLTPPGRDQEALRDIFHLMVEERAVRELAEYFDLEVPAGE